VQLYIEIDNEIETFEVNALAEENDIIKIAILLNPKTLRRNFYNIIGELNEIIAHELEHLYQYSKGEHTYNTNQKNHLSITHNHTKSELKEPDLDE
jgi:hypothetical protein